MKGGIRAGRIFFLWLIIMKDKTVRLCMLAVFTAISVVLVAFVRIPLIPAAPFLEYDMADIPIIIATLMFGTIPGLIVLLITSVIQAFFFGGNGYIGLIMHFVASGAMVVLIGTLYKHKKTIGNMILGLLLGAVAMVVIMIPMNLIFTPIYMGVSVEAVIDLIVPAILPFNALKAVLNCILAGIIFKAISPITKKIGITQ